MKTGYKVCDAMTKAPVTIKPETSLHECAKIMAEKHVGAVLSHKERSCLGIITEQDIVRKSVLLDHRPSEINAAAMMEKELITISPEADLLMLLC